jgi:hypothetical protein
MLTSDESLANILFEYPGADLILRSCDSHYFRVPKPYIVYSSPALDEIIRKTSNPPNHARGEGSLPVVQLSETGAIIHSLLTFVFPVPSIIPPTTEQVMELLSVAQKYQMSSVLAHIRFHIARQNLPSTNRDIALHTYSLSQKYGLREEALQAARIILKYYPMTIGDLEDKLDIMPVASLYELWKYYEKARATLTLDLTEFRTSRAHDTLAGLRCSKMSSSQIPHWLDDYIASIENSPWLFDFMDFNAALSHHIGDRNRGSKCACASIPSQTLRDFWDALTSVIDSAFEKVSVVDVVEIIT